MAESKRTSMKMWFLTVSKCEAGMSSDEETETELDVREDLETRPPRSKSAAPRPGTRDP